jgi:CRP-like cAMP-binding protein
MPATTEVHKNQIKQLFKNLVSISEPDWVTFSGKLHFKRFDKKSRISHPGRVEDRLYFLADGVVRFIVFNDEKESTTDFAFSGQFFSSYSSFITRQPGIFEIRPVTRTADCFYITWQDLQEIYTTTNCGEKIGRMAAEQQFIKKSAREVSLLNEHPKDRYLQLLEEQPKWVQEIPLKHLASYLGIAPETLSRIRRSIQES